MQQAALLSYIPSTKKVCVYVCDAEFTVRKLLHLFYYVNVYVHSSTHVEGRGQLAEVDSLLHQVDPRD